MMNVGEVQSPSMMPRRVASNASNSFTIELEKCISISRRPPDSDWTVLANFERALPSNEVSLCCDCRRSRCLPCAIAGLAIRDAPAPAPAAAARMCRRLIFRAIGFPQL